MITEKDKQDCRIIGRSIVREVHRMFPTVWCRTKRRLNTIYERIVLCIKWI